MNKKLDFGIRSIDRTEDFLFGWERIGMGIRPIEEQISGIKARGLRKLQFHFSKSYGDAPTDLDVLKEFSDIEAIELSEHYFNQNPLEILEARTLQSYRDHVYDRKGMEWEKLSDVKDLALYDCRSKFHPNYEIFNSLVSLDVSHLPRKYSYISDLPVQNARYLRLVKSGLKSFQDFEALSSLKNLKIIENSHFDASGMRGECNSIKSVTIAFCRSVCSLEFVRYMPNLERLSLEGLGEIKSFAPLKEHPSLIEIMSMPLKGEKLTNEVARSIPNLKFVSPAILEH